MERKLRANIPKFYIFNILSGFVLYYSIDKVFMESRGLSVTDIVLVEISYNVARLFFEIPSGAIADRWSRKYALALNMVFFMGNTFLWAVSHNLGLFLTGSLLASIHSSLKSGTDTSFLYDTLKQRGRTDSYVKTLGNSNFWTSVLSIIAGITGGMIAGAFGLALPFWITLPFSFAAVIVALSFTEPEIHRTTGELGYVKHIIETGRFLLSRANLVKLMFFTVALGTAIILADEFGQIYFAAVGIPIFAFGYLDAGGNGLEAIAGKLSYRLDSCGRRKVFGLAVLVSACGLVAAGLMNSIFGVIFLFLPWLAYYITYPLALNDLHRELTSGQRGTGESFMSLLRGIVIIPVEFAFGRAADGFSISMAYLLAGVALGIYLVYFLISYQNGIRASSPS